MEQRGNPGYYSDDPWGYLTPKAQQVFADSLLVHLFKSLRMSIISRLRINVAPLTSPVPDDPDTPFVRLMSQI
jgi:hypothetical protein